MMMSLMGRVMVTEWDSKDEMEMWERGETEYDQLGEMRMPVPPPRPEGLGVWEKENADERAEGVAVF